MPEIKNTFVQGKMNKDFDERILPSGQYRDAMNVQVTTSDDSDIGTVRNLLGNRRVDSVISNSNFKCVGSIANEKTGKIYWFVTSNNKDAILEQRVTAAVEETIPILVDTKAGTNDAVLKFSNNIITGINIIDDLLFWTDNENEPRKINIQSCKEGTSGETNIATTVYGPELINNGGFNIGSTGWSLGAEITWGNSDIEFGASGTPTPQYDKLNQTNNNYWGPEGTIYKVEFDVSNWSTGQGELQGRIVNGVQGQGTSGDTFHFQTDLENDSNPNRRWVFEGPMTADIQSTSFNGRFWIEAKDATGFTGTIDNVSVKELSTVNQITVEDSFNYHTKLIVNGVDYGDIKEEHITVIKKKPLKQPSFKINSSISLDSSLLFEKKIPRFAYRYKYIDGEYSAFGPFTDPIFNPEYLEDIDEDTFISTEEYYNKAMINSIKSIDLYDFVEPNIPENVTQIDILYKQEDSPMVYSIASIDKTDPEWNQLGYNQETSYTNSEYKGKYTVTTENIRAALPSNQLLRSWDNVPKKALAQEVTGNRLVYANYTQGYDMGIGGDGNEIKPSITAGYNNRKQEKSFSESGLPSIKSQRNYQLGIVYGDKYGRETPIFTSSDAAIKILWLNNDGYKLASQSTSLNATLNSYHPVWADYYKVFVKQTSDEYYNLIMDKVFIPSTHNEEHGKDKHLWLSFPSSDRNKIQKDDYIMLKKVLFSNKPQPSFNKFKVVDIENEPPTAIKYKYRSLGRVSNTASGLSGLLNKSASSGGLFHDAAKSITVENEKRIVLNKNQGSGGWNAYGQSLVPLNTTSNVEDVKQDLYLSFYKLDSSGIKVNSKKYKVESIRDGGSNYTVRIKNPGISRADAEMARGNPYTSGGATYYYIHKDISVKFERRTKKEGENFSGRFFVKIAASEQTKNIESQEDTFLDNYYINSRNKTMWLADTPNAAGTNTFDTGIINTQWDSATLPSSNTAKALGAANLDVTNTPAAWANITNELINNEKTGFFIDGMHFAAGQIGGLNGNNYARNSGQIWMGAEHKYPYEPLWRYHDASNPNGFVDSETVKLHNWKHRPSNSIKIETNDPSELINGLESFITTTLIHTETARRWKRKQDNLAEVLGSTLFNQSSAPSSIIPSQVYGSRGTSGKYFLHLSFLSPGRNLVPHAINGDELAGINAIGNSLQGIWGGGVFTKHDGSGFGQNNDLYHLPMEGKFNIEMRPDPWVPPVPPGPNVLDSYGYDTKEDYEERHEKQWDPMFGQDAWTSEEKEYLNNFLKNLKKGSRFKFKDDSTNTIYKIKKCRKRCLYNHTAWRRAYKWDGSTSGTLTPDNGLDEIYSVERVALEWADTLDSNGSGGDATKYNALQDAIINFGKSNNRRIVYILELDKDPTTASAYNPLDGSNIDASINFDHIEFINSLPSIGLGEISNEPAIWETESKEGEKLDIYYEASQAYPTKLNKKNRELFAPVGCEVEILDTPEAKNGKIEIYQKNYLESWDDANNGLQITLNVGFNDKDYLDTTIDYEDKQIRFYRKDGSYTTGILTIASNSTAVSSDYRTMFVLKEAMPPGLEVGLNWFNCYSFGNGIESNRVRDDFNAMQITNGVKVSATLEESYKEEKRKNGLIYSGLYNSTTGINDLNQFVMAEKITKDLNPSYGSIQKLFQRRISLIAFCEDRVVGITSNKDALYNADGKPQLVSTNLVLGDANPFVGDFGISKNPESFSSESYRAYFTDKQRGAVLRLSMDGLTPISDAGMRSWFRDNLKISNKLIGTYDNSKKEYNLTLTDYLPENLIVNSLGEEGEISIESIPNPEYLIDGNLNLGTPPVGGTSASMNLNNETLDTTVTITNHPEIIQDYFGTNVDPINIGDYNSGGLPLLDDQDGDGINDVYSVTEFETASDMASAWNIYEWFDHVNPMQQNNENYGSGTNPSDASYWTFGDSGNTAGDLQNTVDLDGDGTYESHAIGGDGDGAPHSGNPQSNTPPNDKFHQPMRWQQTVGSGGGWIDYVGYEPGNSPAWDSDGTTSSARFCVPHPGWASDVNPSYQGGNWTDGTKGPYNYNDIIHPDVLSGVSVTSDTALSAQSLPSPWTTALGIDTTTTFLSNNYSSFNLNTNTCVASNLTIFNGEEFYIEFNIWNRSSGTATGDNLIPKIFIGDCDIDTISTNTFSTTNGFGLGAGGIFQPLPHDGSSYTGTTPFDTPQYTLPNDTDDDTSTTSSTSGYYKAGWYNDMERIRNGGSTFTQSDWTTMNDTSWLSGIQPGDTKTYRLHFKAWDGTYEEKPLISKLLTAIGFRGGNAKRWTMWKFKIKKVTRMKSPKIDAVAADPTTATPNVNPEPPVTIPAWTEISHSLPEWGSSGGGFTYFPNAIATYGVANPGTTVTSTQNTGNSWIDGTGNGTTTFDQYFTGVYNTPSTTTINDKITIDTSNNYITQDITNNPLIDGNWYEVRVKYTGTQPTNPPIIHKVLDSDISVNVPGTTPDDHVGVVTGGTSPSGSLSMESHPTLTQIYYAVWKQSALALGDNNIFKIQQYNFTGDIDKIELIDITDAGLSSTMVEWDLQNNKPLVNSNSLSDLFYNNLGEVEWANNNTQYILSNDLTLKQAFDPTNIPVTTVDGYELRFNISGYVQGKLQTHVRGDDGNGAGTGFKYTNIDADGYYQIRGNIDSTYGNQTGDVLLDGNSIASSIAVSSASTINNIVFSATSAYASTYSPFVGKIDNISLVDITNHFVGGTIDSWSFHNFDVALENYIIWNSANKNIEFSNAPTNVELRQIISTNLKTDDTYNLKFNIENYSGNGSISGYYYNTDGKGFLFGPLTANESFDKEFVIGEKTTSDTAALLQVAENTVLRNTFVIYVDGEPFNASLDNFVLNQIFTEFTPTTVTFNEDVKGWVSFKSFIPESGLSLSNNYYTLKQGKLYKHHDSPERNTFYTNSFEESTITTVLNESPSFIKIFNTLNYEGSQSKVPQYTTKTITGDSSVTTLSNINSDNISSKDGWYVSNIKTDKQNGTIDSFIEKEGKWFNYIRGEYGDIDTSSIAFQGLGVVNEII